MYCKVLLPEASLLLAQVPVPRGHGVELRHVRRGVRGLHARARRGLPVQGPTESARAPAVPCPVFVGCRMHFLIRSFSGVLARLNA